MNLKPRKPKFPENLPKDPAFGLSPQSDWQVSIKDELSPLLSSHGWTKRRAGFAYFQGYMVQVYLDNWTLHFQVSTDGNEFSNPSYGNINGRALVAFDVEDGKRGVKRTDLLHLQECIRQALAEEDVYSGLELSPSDAKEHHLVMDASIGACDVASAARRLVQFMDAIYDIAAEELGKLESA